MIRIADRPIQRPTDGKLLIADACGRLTHAPRSALIEALHEGDLVIANDAATLPASLQGTHVPSGHAMEIRLAARRSLATDDVMEFAAIAFGEGDFRVRTEARPAPPQLAPNDQLRLGPLTATVVRLLGHPRLIWIRFDGSPDDVWAGLSRHGRPIQYAHMPQPLALWDVWTPIAGPPVAFEPPSAGFVLDWRLLGQLHAHGIEFATLTHAAGISSTGDAALDARLPFDEPYTIPTMTAFAIDRARLEHKRIVAVGTTVVRALEHARSRGCHGAIPDGPGLADQRIGPDTPLHVVSAIVSGVHESETSHYQLLRAFASDELLERMAAEMTARKYRTHEFGDSVFLEASFARAPQWRMVGSTRPCWMKNASSSGVIPLVNSRPAR